MLQRKFQNRKTVSDGSFVVVLDGERKKKGVMKMLQDERKEERGEERK